MRTHQQIQKDIDSINQEFERIRPTTERKVDESDLDAAVEAALQQPGNTLLRTYRTSGDLFAEFEGDNKYDFSRT